MKILVIGSEARYRAYLPDLPLTQRAQLAFAPNGADNAAIAAALPEAEILAVDAISRVDADLMDRLPRLRLIQSEGVGYNAIDGRAAHGIGTINKAAVAPACAPRVYDNPGTHFILVFLAKDTILVKVKLDAVVVAHHRQGMVNACAPGLHIVFARHAQRIVLLRLGNLLPVSARGHAKADESA